MRKTKETEKKLQLSNFEEIYLQFWQTELTHFRLDYISGDQSKLITEDRTYTIPKHLYEDECEGFAKPWIEPLYYFMISKRYPETSKLTILFKNREKVSFQKRDMEYVGINVKESLFRLIYRKQNENAILIQSPVSGMCTNSFSFL